METSRPRGAGGQPFVPCSACWGQRAVACRSPGNVEPPIAMSLYGHSPRSGCDVAVLAAPLHHGPSTTGVSARVSQCPRRRLGSQSQKNTMPLALTAVARNGYVESINSRIRDQCPTINGFWSLAQARVVTERLSFAWTNLRGPATATGRRRTDPYSVIPQRAAGASRGA
jgi:hypothetical protein